MQKIISKYAMAAHLALMAVAPLFLLPLVGATATATVTIWLSAFGFVWVLMEPSRRKGEMPHSARARVAKAVVADPLFWFSLILVVYTGLRMLNGGIGLAYDAEHMEWSIRQPFFDLLPGCVDGAGYFPFAATLALSIVFQGVRHALGRSARSSFLLVSSVISSLAAVIFAFAITYRHAGVWALARCSSLSASYFGTVFGIQFLCSVAAFFSVVRNKWMRVEPLAALGVVGNATGLVIFAPPLTIAVFAALFLILAVSSFILSRHVFEGSGSFRCALVILLAVGAPVMYVLATADTPEMAQKIAVFTSAKPFADDFWSVRTTLSALALKAWKANPWIGTGLASFPLDLRFMAAAADWDVLSPSQQTALNGWWHFLVERGVVGVLMMAIAFGMLVWTYVSRLVRSFSEVSFTQEHLVGPLAVAALVALAFVECSFLRPEVLLLTGAYFAFSGGAFPARRAEDHGVEN